MEEDRSSDVDMPDGNANGLDHEVSGEEITSQDDSFHCFTGHSNSVFCVDWSPIGNLTVASGGQDDFGYLWKTCNPDSEMEELPCATLEGHTDSVIDIKFNHNGELLASGGMDGLVKIWSKEGVLLKTLEGPSDALTWICWHPRGDVILAGSADFSSWMWNVQNGVCMQVFSGHGSAVSCGRFSTDGRLVFTCGEDEDPSLKIWNPRTGSCTITITGHSFHESGITCLAVNSESSMGLTGSSDCTARLSNLITGHPVGTLSESVESVGFVEGVLPVLMTGSLDGKVISWDSQTLNQRHSYHHPSGIVCIRALTQSPVLVSGSLDGIVRLWDTRRSQSIKELSGFNDAIQCLAVSPNEQFIMAGSDDATVRIFDIRQM